MIQIAKLQMADSRCSELWTENFGIGSIVEGKIHEAKEFGVVVSFEKYSDVFGFAPRYQCKSFVNLSGAFIFTICCRLIFL